MTIILIIILKTVDKAMKIIQFFVKLIVRLCEGQNLTIVLTIILKTVHKAMKFMQFS